MSVLEIPDKFYEIIYAQEVANALDKDPYHDLKAARQRAQEIMGHCFSSRAIVECTEYQKDHDAYVEEMSLGGRPYRTR